MTISRRNFLELFSSTICLTAFSASETATSSNLESNFLSVIQGDPFDGFSQFSILSIARRPLRYFIYKDDRQLQEIAPYKVTHPTLNSKIDKVFVKGLQINVEYQLRIYEENRLVDVRYFKSISSQKKQNRLAMLSCMDDQLHQPSMWQSLYQSQPDLILFIGDSVYADSDGPANPFHLWRRFAASRFTLDIFKWKRLIPVLSIWDDHDFGANNAGINYPFIKETQHNFRSFYAQDYYTSPNLMQGPGIAKAFKLGETQFLLLDGRSFRQNPGSNLEHSMFGKDQEYWCYQMIQRHPGTTMLINGSQWFPNSGVGESFNHDHNINFIKFLQNLKTLKKKIIFGSGDVHFSEIIKIPDHILGFQTYEITSSSMHSQNIIGAPQYFNSENSILSTWKHNYKLLEFQNHLQRTLVQTQSIGSSHNQIYSHKFWL